MWISTAFVIVLSVHSLLPDHLHKSIILTGFHFDGDLIICIAYIAIYTKYQMLI